MIEIIIALTALLFAAIFNSEMDTIKFRPQQAWSQSDWWLRNKWDKYNWWLKVPFSFLSDGWHFCKGVQEYCYALLFGLVVTLTFSFPFWYAFLIAVIVYAVRGIIWEFFYKLKNEF